MHKKLWLVVLLCLVIPCFMFTVSCQKKVAAQATVVPKSVIASPTAPSAPSMSSPTVVNFMDERIYFEFDKSNLDKKAWDILNKKAEWLKTNPNSKLVIEGHCDERGTAEYNIALGWRRAENAKRYLIDVSGINSNRITSISYGEEKPICKEKTEACWAKNRNDSFIVK